MSGLSSHEAEALRQLADPEWRIRNLYWIMDKRGAVVPFRMNESQEEFLRALWYRNLILKARQHGFSTLIQYLMLDQCVFCDNIRAGTIAHNMEAATSIFRDKVKFGYDHLPPMVREMRPRITDSVSELSLSNNSLLRVATSHRSGTLQYLHVSEFGKICATSPGKAREIITGSIPTVDADGFVFIESTAEGQEGYYYDMTERAKAIKLEGRKLGQEDYRFHFSGWWAAKEYSASSGSEQATDKDNEYFDSIESKISRPITEDQRRWYVTKREVGFHGDSQMMKQEYPSIPEEAFEQSVEGCYYSSQMAEIRRSGRITTVPYMPGYPVNTFWDIGNSDGTAIWFHQHIGFEDRFIRFYENWGEHYSHYVAEMQQHGYVWGKHYLPHDAGHQRQGEIDNHSPKEKLENLGLRGIEIVKRVPDIQQGIQSVRAAFPTCSFDSTNCAEGIKHLDGYRKQWDDARGRWRDEPRHDVHSEAADAFRQFAQGYETPAKRHQAATFARGSTSAMRTRAF